MTTEQMDWLDDERAGRHEPHRDAENEPRGEFIPGARITIDTETGERRNPGIGVKAWNRDELALRVMGNDNQPIRVRPGEIRDLFHSQTTELQKRIQELEQNARELSPSRFASEAEQGYLEAEEDRRRDQRILQREEAVELVTVLLAGAGFELLRDQDGETAMWQQKLASRPIAQVFVMVTDEQLHLPPAELFTLIKSQVGVA